jgi:hypothetical protein
MLTDDFHPSAEALHQTGLIAEKARSAGVRATALACDGVCRVVDYVEVRP